MVDDETSAPRMRVVTLNVYGPANPRWAERRRLLRDGLAALQPDVVALQEVQRTGTYDAVDDLLGDTYHRAWFSRPSDDGVGGVLASRWPMRIVAEIDQHVSARTREALPWCATLIAEVDTPLGRVLAAHHKPVWPFGWEHEREQQAVRAATALEDLYAEKERHVLVLGDFDATPDSASVQFWTGRRSLEGVSVCYSDAWELAGAGGPGLTFARSNPLVREGQVATAIDRRIDYLLVRAGLHGPTLQVVDCRVALDIAHDGLHPSDHFGVVADLSLPRHPPGEWSGAG